MKASEIKVGDCYRTANNQIRYVESIEDGKVRYRTRTGKNEENWINTAGFQFQKLSMFSGDVIELVSQNWDVDQVHKPLEE